MSLPSAQSWREAAPSEFDELSGSLHWQTLGLLHFERRPGHLSCHTCPFRGHGNSFHPCSPLYSVPISDSGPIALVPLPILLCSIALECGFSAPRKPPSGILPSQLGAMFPCGNHQFHDCRWPFRGYDPIMTTYRPLKCYRCGNPKDQKGHLQTSRTLHICSRQLPHPDCHGWADPETFDKFPNCSNCPPCPVALCAACSGEMFVLNWELLSTLRSRRNVDVKTPGSPPDNPHRIFTVPAICITRVEAEKKLVVCLSFERIGSRSSLSACLER